jgi:hypothetical protein
VTALANACRGVPFSNGTERGAWEAAWCAYCERDHDVSHDGANGRDLRCELLMRIDLAARQADLEWPEAWLPEPDDGRFFLPSRLVCGAFSPCHVDACNGDPGATERAERVSEVQSYWRDRGTR